MNKFQVHYIQITIVHVDIDMSVYMFTGGG